MMTAPKSTESKLQDNLAVFLDEKLVGVLRRFDADNHVFQIDDNYSWEKGDPIMTVSMRMGNGDMNRAPVHSRSRLPTFFSNLLPEGSLREYLAAQAGVKSQREFALLSALADDLPGGIVLQPADDSTLKAPSFQHSNDFQRIHREGDVLRFSLAGVQLKFSAIQAATGGLTIPANGAGGSYIVKLPSTRFSNVPENEYSMMQLARRMGMQVAETELRETSSIEGLPENLPENFGHSLVVKRFDRDKNKRIHMEDFAQVFKLYPHDKYNKVSYGNIGYVVWAESGAAQLQEYIRRLTFSLLIGNADMHSKNWSLLYLEPQKPILSPAYDFISTITYLPDFKLALSIAGQKSMHEVQMMDFRKMAVKAKLPESMIVREVQNTLELFHQHWRDSKENLPMSQRLITTIEAHQKNLQISTRQ